MFLHPASRRRTIEGSAVRPRAPLRVLFVDNSATFGGAIISLGRLVSSLDGEAVRATVVSAQPAERLRELFPATEAVHLPMWVPWEATSSPVARKVPGGGALAAGWNLLSKRLPTARRLADLGREAGTDLVHLNNALEAQVDGLLAARMLGVPCVAHARGFQTPTRALALYAGQAAAHIAISASIRDNLVEIGADPGRIRIIHNGIDLIAFDNETDVQTVRRSLGLPENAPVFAFFGRIVPWKGVLELVEAAEMVLRLAPSAYGLIVGDASDGSDAYVQSVRERVRALGLEDRIRFTGYRADVADLMRAADVIVHTSVAPEPFGLVIVEAMAARKPVVAADAGGPRDIVAEGETGRLVDPRDPEALGRAIAHLLLDPEGARSMGRAGRKRVEERFSEEAEARAIQALYHEVATVEPLRTAR